MTAIKLINKNGKIIGKDPDTGQTVPIELGSDLKVDGALEANDGTISNKPITGLGNSSAGDLSFGDWEQVSDQRPASILLRAEVETDSSSRGAVFVEVDEDGGTNADYTLVLAEAKPSLASGSQIVNSLNVPLPQGAQYRILNESDPNASNKIELERVFEK